MILREGDIRIAAGNHLREIAMHDADATSKGRRLRGEEDVGCGVSDQAVEGRPVPGPGLRFLDIGQRDPCPGTWDVGEAVKSRVGCLGGRAARGRDFREKARLPLDHPELAQLSQGSGPAMTISG